ncbi:NACHT and WD40 domain protein [Aspergillus campestris IBT 28561]|uniref:Mitochondrial division protein 1 n=1 Tax=Aspergillus campestris (strain IBT 28561) TaxID=1392248 RepID=A0A2I1D2J1_ASPC2|nr:NACHT and WD40 domain protein [Aspergillus campestris IBT 28561]PKY04101.1 NACHT and WD40 domain protein [Aspergillus campestris IBT 28561]
MEVLASATTVISVIQVTAGLVKLCGGYIQEVKDARDDIISLQQEITGLHGTLQELQKLLQGNNKKALPTSSQLVSNIADCLSDLQALEAKLNPGKGKNLMRKMGLRSLKWPLKRAEVEGVIRKLERYNSSFLLSLQVDQTALLADMVQDNDRINQYIEFEQLEGVLEAGFESFSDRDEVQCLQGTRTELLQKIMGWAKSPSQQSIFWLKGMAGTGKSTISRTVAGLLKDTNHLGASFFFKRGEGDRGNAKKLFPTLTRQLILWYPELRPGVRKSLDQDPDIASKSLGEQFDKLLLQPLLNLQPDGQPLSAVIVIDALDECEHDQDTRNIIRLLPLLQKVKSVHLQIFLTSRPELPVNLGFSELGDHAYQSLALHDIPEEVTGHDIYLFLQNQFASIKRDRKISDDWPGDDIIQELVRISIPLFISAATVCRYIENSKWEPRLRLEELLKDQAKYVSRMDKTYLPILTRLLDDQESDAFEQQQLLQEFHDIIGTIIVLAVPLSINGLSNFLGLGADQISNRLDSFRSVLSVPHDRDQPVRILHLSFRDFLVQSTARFHVKEPKKNKDIAKTCLKTMHNCLRKDICNLADPGVLRADINPEEIRQYLPLELQYSCRYWVYHLTQSEDLSSEVEEIRMFLQKHFLHWLEAMSLLGLMSDVVGMLDSLHTVVSDNDGSALVKFLHDAKRFVLKNRQIADEAPLQIYCAGLVFAPRASIIRGEFEQDLPSWISCLPEVNENWGAELQTLEGHSDYISSVAFSPNGRLLASCSRDNTIRLWNPETGALQNTLEGHLPYGIFSVIFSPDGRLLASSSSDETIRLWDPETGALQQTIEDYIGAIEEYVGGPVAFSPDSQLLAYSSICHRVQLWNPAKGALQHTLEGHSGDISSIIFTPDCQLLASCSKDKTVRLWDPVTGTLQHTIEALQHPLENTWRATYSGAFSPDGKLLAFGCSDKTLQLWDPVTGVLQQSLESYSGGSVVFSADGRLLASGPCNGTSQLWDPVTGALQQTFMIDRDQPVAFSPDGRMLAFGSSGTVQLWDPATGALQQTLEGHSSIVISVAFSPNGWLLASGSSDKTVRLWDLTANVLQQDHQSHLDPVHSVFLSPNGRRLASCTYDNVVQLWDPVKGALQKTLEGHSNLGSVYSAAFSPNNQLLAAGSPDTTVQVWDLVTGVLQQTFRGHSNTIFSVAFSTDNKLLASGSSDRTVQVWDLVTGSLQQTLNDHSDAVYSVAFSYNGKLLASCCYDQKVRLWDVEKGTLQRTLEGHLGSVYLAAFSPDDQLLASYSYDQTVRLWDTATGYLKQIFTMKETVTDLKFAEDVLSLRTNLGSLKIQSRPGSPIFNSLDTIPTISLQQDFWIALDRKRVLWLPPEARPTCSVTTSNMAILGHASGRVSFIGFR